MRSYAVVCGRFRWFPFQSYPSILSMDRRQKHTHFAAGQFVAVVTVAGAGEAILEINALPVEGYVRRTGNPGERLRINATSLEGDVIDVSADDLLFLQ